MFRFQNDIISHTDDDTDVNKEHGVIITRPVRLSIDGGTAAFTTRSFTAGLTRRTDLLASQPPATLVSPLTWPD